VKLRFLTAGDRGLMVELGDEVDLAINRRVHALARLIQAEDIAGVEELIPTYRSILVIYDPLILPYDELVERIRGLATEEASSAQVRTVTLPTCYGGEFGPDLEDVARHNGLTTQEVIDIHTSRGYPVFCLGFSPGFPYLGGMSERIAMPRLENPRTKVPAGSVGIAGTQTGVYPSETPGGWRIIGRTPVRLYLPERDPPVLLRPGDVVRFRAIDEEEYREIARLERDGRYEPEIAYGGGEGE